MRRSPVLFMSSGNGVRLSFIEGGEHATSTDVNMVEGKADFGNQVLQINVNMYYDQTAECFQEKKVNIIIITEFFFLYDENSEGREDGRNCLCRFI